MKTDSLSEEEIEKLAIARIASLFQVPESSIRGEMILGKDLRATFQSDFRENELDKVYYDILNAANRETYDKLERGKITIQSVQDYCKYMAECYRVNSREVLRILN